MGSARRNLLALGAFAVLMAGGIVVGRWASSRSMRLDPAVAADVPVASADRLRLVAIGDVGEGNATQRQVRDAIARYCEAHGCDMAVLLGDNLYQRGMETPDDPRLDEIIGDMYGAWPFPTYMVLGNHDYNHALDRQRAAWQVAWANRTDGFEMPSATWTAAGGPAALWGLDTTEVFFEGAEPQAAWIADTLRASSARWRVAFAHHTYVSDGPHGNAGSYDGLPGVPYVDGAAVQSLFADSVCGKFDLVLSGHDHSRQWHEACGTAWVISGTGSKATDLQDNGNRAVHRTPAHGFVWIELGDVATVRFVDVDGTVTFEAVRDRDGTVRTPDGSTMRRPE